MRDIKFRVFAAERMIVVEPSADFTITFGNESPRLAMYSNGGEFVEEDNVSEVMQYTGLKDKNGVEIYEGDIVGDGNGETNGQVVWDSTAACYAILSQGAMFTIYDDGLSDSDEVIGNIHENAELLTDKEDQ